MLLANYQIQAHTETFMQLKTLLLTESVLKGPYFDDTPFIITSDGCKDGFSATHGENSDGSPPNCLYIEMNIPQGS
ncbi:hypothetical protein F4604DRAFT_1590797 [Suillus subluteus]|nr:hypothetical protein F4604DRAFT_1599016 [Suillus subluteus]KAG1855283.1 hypothetical protein F4604DRAFT_1590797 [Suillus subluteus]